MSFRPIMSASERKTNPIIFFYLCSLLPAHYFACTNCRGFLSQLGVCPYAVKLESIASVSEIMDRTRAGGRALAGLLPLRKLVARVNMASNCCLVVALCDAPTVIESAAAAMLSPSGAHNR